MFDQGWKRILHAGFRLEMSFNFHVSIPWFCSRGFHKHKKLPTLALLPNLYSHIFAVYFFLLHMMLVNVKLDISGYQLVSFIFNSTAKTKLAILAFLYCVVFVKTSSVPLKTRSNTFIVKY